MSPDFLKVKKIPDPGLGAANIITGPSIAACRTVEALARIGKVRARNCTKLLFTKYSI